MPFGKALSGGLAGMAALLLWAPAASAATITVDETDDEFALNNDRCALREAIHASQLDGIAPASGCAVGGANDVIRVPPGTYELTRQAADDDNNVSNDLDLFIEDVTIKHVGDPEDPVQIDGSDQSGVFHVQGVAELTLDGVTIQNGFAGAGSAVLTEGSAVSVIRNSTIRDNVQTAAGAVGVYVSAQATLENTTVSGNQGLFGAGGIHVENGSLALLHSTVTDNTADANGNGSFGGGGLSVFEGELEVRSSIVARNRDLDPTPVLAPDCITTSSFPVTSLGHNLVGSLDGCDLEPKPRDVIGANPRVGPLSFNGGPTATHALKAKSKAIGKGPGNAPKRDQRAAPRAGQPDIGAYERVKCGGALVEWIGTPGKDRLEVSIGADGVLGLGGNDTLIGLPGDDGLCGGPGKDLLRGGPGADFLDGGPGRDRCKGGPGKDRLRSC
jgi:RTX calcium-binding nonapeptide repeat (4 copies)/Protein of unknown function (DUF1565)